MGPPAQSPSKKRILIAPACFKGSLSAWAVGMLIRDFLRTHFDETVLDLDVCPIADGGDDTLDILHQADPTFERHTVEVTGPLPGTRVQASYLLHPVQKLAVVEAAQAHGLKLLQPQQYDPLWSTSYGVGEVLTAVFEQCCVQAISLERLVVTVGGSASTDGGLGALQALHVKFLDRKQQPLPAPLGGGHLKDVQAVEWLPQWPAKTQLLIATDVVNPLLGKNGAAHVFAPQKGASPAQCKQLEKGLQHVSKLLSKIAGIDHSAFPGAGSAGGLAYGLRHLPRSGLISGSQWISEVLHLEARIAQADLIITGEGCFDASSFSGKATGHVLVWAANKPTWVLCGQTQAGLTLAGNSTVTPLATTPEQVVEAIQHPEKALLNTLENALPTLRQFLNRL